jgi:hypothetical protein
VGGELVDHHDVPGLKDVSLPLAYGLYPAFALRSLLFVIRFIAETKGKQLEDMQG